MSGVDERVETLEDAILDLADLAAGWCSPKARGNPDVVNAAVEKCRASASVLAAAVAGLEQRADDADKELTLRVPALARSHEQLGEEVKALERMGRSYRDLWRQAVRERDEARAGMIEFVNRTTDLEATVRRVWEALGNPGYESLGGQSISEVVAARAAAATAAIDALRLVLNRIESYSGDVAAGLLDVSLAQPAALHEIDTIARAAVDAYAAVLDHATPAETCDACGSPMTSYDRDGQWCDAHATPAAADEERQDDLVVLGRCPHGVDLDINFCPQGCRV